MSSCGESPESYLYQYDENGNLLSYQYRQDKKDIFEYFNSTGELVGFRIDFNEEPRYQIYNWQGRAVDGETFRNRRNALTNPP